VSVEQVKATITMAKVKTDVEGTITVAGKVVMEAEATMPTEVIMIMVKQSVLELESVQVLELQL
jgi:hypothetical protein